MEHNVSEAGKKLQQDFTRVLQEMTEQMPSSPDLENLKWIDVSRIQAGKYQPRTQFDVVALEELALSIAEHGILQPLVVRRIAPEKYEIIAGERRFRAGMQVGLHQMPCIIKQYDDQQALAVALIENLQRSDLNILEVAESLQKLVDNFQLTHEKIAKLIGRSRSAVSNILRLLALDTSVKQALVQEKIDMGHARALLSLPKAEQFAVLQIICQQQLTVRQTEAKVRAISRNTQVPKQKNVMKNHDIVALENALSDYMGYSVSINHQQKGHGKLVLKYKNLDELDAILIKWGYKKSH